MNNQEQNDNLSIFNSPLDNNNEQNQTGNANAQINQAEGLSEPINHMQQTTPVQSVNNTGEISTTINTGVQQTLTDPLMQPMDNINQTQTISNQKQEMQSNQLLQPMNNETINNIEQSINNEPSQQMMPPINNNISNNNSYSDEELLRAFIGNNFEKVATNRFNFSAFFFSSFYFLYRKMYLVGIILVILSAVVSYFFKSTFIIGILISIISGFAFNSLYLNFVSKKIERIKATSTTEDIKAVCTRKGGTSILLAILVFIGYIIFATIFLTAAMFASLFSGLNFANGASGNALSLHVDASLYMGFCNEGYEECTVQYPYSDDGSNISCTLDSKNSSWHITPGYTLSADSASCEEFMSAVYDYSSLTEKDLPDGGEIIITSNGLIEDNGTKFIYGNQTCTYNTNNSEFECKI